jgi:DNA-binding transcriptional MocR family regulator
MRSGLRTAAPLAHASAFRPGYRPPVAWMLTLTYAQADAYQPRHLSDCLKRLRRWAAARSARLIGYWVAEMQDKRFRLRGERAIHYHVIVWLPDGLTPPRLDAEGIWPHGMTRRDRVVKSADGYLMKYASKGSESPLPKGARIFGSFGLGTFRHQYTHARRPAWLREITAVGERLHRLTGGGWLSEDSGEVMRSPWLVQYVAGAIYITRRAEHG